MAYYKRIDGNKYDGELIELADKLTSGGGYEEFLLQMQIQSTKRCVMVIHTQISKKILLHI